MSEYTRSMKTMRFVAVLAAALASLVLSGCGGGEEGSGGEGGSLTLVAYSTPRAAYEQLTSDFGETEAGQGVTFETSYGASGEQSRAVEGGLPADVVALSLEPDITRLVEAGLVDSNWNEDQYKGMVTDSVAVFVTRKGNPKHITKWEDLVKPGVQVITPNPFTSGGAQWNLMAAYGAQLEQGKSEEEALDFIKQILENTPVQDASARDSLQTFVGGKGDVLLSYENEAIAAQQAGEDIDYVIPDQTILIENPVAVTEDADPKAQAFRDFLFTEEAQKIYQDHGYRPILKNLANESEFPTPPDLFEIDKFGGWDKVRSEFFDPENGSVATIEEELGVATSD